MKHDCLAATELCSMSAGLYSSSLTARLAHLCDTVIGLEAVRDDSDIVCVIPEPARCVLHVSLLQLLLWQYVVAHCYCRIELRCA